MLPHVDDDDDAEADFGDGAVVDVADVADAVTAVAADAAADAYMLVI